MKSFQKCYLFSYWQFMSSVQYRSTTYKMLMWSSVPISEFLSGKYLQDFVRSLDYCLLGYDVMLYGKSFSMFQGNLLRPGWKNLHLEDGVTRVSSQPVSWGAHIAYNLAWSFCQMNLILVRYIIQATFHEDEIALFFFQKRFIMQEINPLLS